MITPLVIALVLNGGNLTPDQKAEKKELLAKYDTNKDGKIDKTEAEPMSYEQKLRWKELAALGKGKKSPEEIMQWLELIKKYDADHDAWLSPNERSKMSDEDKKAWAEVSKAQ
jgi:hypothetical protein